MTVLSQEKKFSVLLQKKEFSCIYIYIFVSIKKRKPELSTKNFPKRGLGKEIKKRMTKRTGMNSRKKIDPLFFVEPRPTI